jgi:hypothetical protein
MSFRPKYILSLSKGRGIGCLQTGNHHPQQLLVPGGCQHLL